MWSLRVEFGRLCGGRVRRGEGVAVQHRFLSTPRSGRAAWRDAMYRLGLPVGELAGSEPPSASVTCLTSPLGMEFALIDAGPQTISGRRTDQPASVWLAVLLDGKRHARERGRRTVALAVGDIAFGPTGRTATLLLETRCRLMFVKAPRVALDHRLVAVRGLKVGRLESPQGVAQDLLRPAARHGARRCPRLTVGSASAGGAGAHRIPRRQPGGGERRRGVRRRRPVAASAPDLPEHRDPASRPRPVAARAWRTRTASRRATSRSCSPPPRTPSATTCQRAAPGALQDGPGQSAVRAPFDLGDLLPLGI